MARSVFTIITEDRNAFTRVHNFLIARRRDAIRAYRERDALDIEDAILLLHPTDLFTTQDQRDRPAKPRRARPPVLPRTPQAALFP